MANKDVRNNVAGKVPASSGPNTQGLGGREGSEITSASPKGGATSGTFGSGLGKLNVNIANLTSPDPMQAASYLSMAPEVALEYTPAKAINMMLPSGGGDPATNVTGSKVAGDKPKPKSLYSKGGNRSQGT